ncbi:MAG: hypothetical protein O3A53_19030 [Acidobacteria bacterium]|nr:hypothetical protein [Acidobacteriota bacterium]MDA1236880.1 hypothetical protein [Acidobacteriota bacterium]
MVFRTLAALVLLAAPLFAGQSLEITADTGTYTTPAGAPWNVLGARRFEMRAELTGFSCPATNQVLWAFGDLNLRCSTAGAGVLWIWHESSGGSISYSGRTDVLIRGQFDPDNDRLTV